MGKDGPCLELSELPLPLIDCGIFGVEHACSIDVQHVGAKMWAGEVSGAGCGCAVVDVSACVAVVVVDG
jgi:hypothetical protein